MQSVNVPVRSAALPLRLRESIAREWLSEKKRSSVWLTVTGFTASPQQWELEKSLWRSASPSANSSLVVEKGVARRRRAREKRPRPEKIHETRVTSAKAKGVWAAVPPHTPGASDSLAPAGRAWPVAVARELAPHGHGHARRAAGPGAAAGAHAASAHARRVAARTGTRKRGLLGGLTLLLERGSVHGPRHATTTRSIASSSSSASAAAGRPAGLGFWRPYRLRYLSHRHQLTQ